MKDDFANSMGKRLEVKSPATYKRCLRVGGIIAKLFGGIAFSGQENLPHNGAFMIAANHVSMFDPLIVAYALMRSTGDQVHFLANKELWERDIELEDRTIHTGWMSVCLGNLLDDCGAIPIERNKRLSSTTLSRLDNIVDNEGVLGIFPEGGLLHNPEIGHIHIGAGMLAARYGLDIVPVGLVGADPLRGSDGRRDFGHFHVHFGEALEVPYSRQTVKTGRQFTPVLREHMQHALEVAREHRSAND